MLASLDTTGGSRAEVVVRVVDPVGVEVQLIVVPEEVRTEVELATKLCFIAQTLTRPHQKANPHFLEFLSKSLSK